MARAAVTREYTKRVDSCFWNNPSGCKLRTKLESKMEKISSAVTRDEGRMCNFMSQKADKDSEKKAGDSSSTN